MTKLKLTATNKDSILTLLGSLDLENKSYDIEIKRWRPRRTNPQNNLLWKWHSEVAAEFSAFTGKQWSPEQVHYYFFCRRFLSGETMYLPGGETEWVGETSSGQDITAMSEAMSKYEVWCLQNDIQITHPDEGL